MVVRRGFSSPCPFTCRLQCPPKLARESRHLRRCVAFPLEELGGVDHVALLLPEWQENLVNGILHRFPVPIAQLDAGDLRKGV